VNDVSEINDINKKIAWTKRFIKFTEELVKKFSDMSDEVEKIRVKIRTMLKVV
jgi:phage regulator Rha-like protein